MHIFDKIAFQHSFLIWASSLKEWTNTIPISHTNNDNSENLFNYSLRINMSTWIAQQCRIARLMLDINSHMIACDVLPFVAHCCVKPSNDLRLWIHTNKVSGHNRPWVRKDTNRWIFSWQQEIGRTGKNVLTYLAVLGFDPPHITTVLSANAWLLKCDLYLRPDHFINTFPCSKTFADVKSGLQFLLTHPHT